VTIKNTVFWGVAPCRYCVKRRFGGTYPLHLQGKKIRERGTNVNTWLQAARFSETSVHTAFFRSFLICTSHQMLLGLSNQGRWNGNGGRKNCIIIFFSKILKESEDLTDRGVDGKILLRKFLQEYGSRMWAGFIWLKIKSSVGLL
jgi:hypothetical protein